MLRMLSRTLAPFVVVMGLVIGAGAAQAQTISQPNGDNLGGATGFGQSFTATVTGQVTEIQVRPRATAANVRFYFFNGPGSGTAGSNAGAVSSQLVNITDRGANDVGAGFQTITLATPLQVVAGNQYAWGVDAVVGFAVDVGAPYAGGTAIRDYNSPEPYDLAFTVTEVPTPPVPTLSEWAMILLGLTLAGGAVLMIQRRRLVG